jgi:nicotinamidase/pyrazinamidase
MVRPKFYDEKKVGTIYTPRFDEIVAEAATTPAIPSSKDRPGQRVAILDIDMQIDFCHEPVRRLYVPGAENDIRRSIEFILANFDKITTIFASLDTHLMYQIFYSEWWMNKKGEHPTPFTMITADAVDKGEWMPTQDPINSINYVKSLKTQGNKDLCIWPYHTMLGTIGQALDPALFEIYFYHAKIRRTQTTFLQKGIIPQTEMYGILSPEVQIPTHPMGGFNTSFLKLVMDHDKTVIRGQAKSHCVLESLKQIYNYFINSNPEVLKRIYILEDCMSSVVHPAVDFEALTQVEFNTFRNSGINIVKSTDSILD